MAKGAGFEINDLVLLGIVGVGLYFAYQLIGKGVGQTIGAVGDTATTVGGAIGSVATGVSGIIGTVTTSTQKVVTGIGDVVNSGVNSVGTVVDGFGTVVGDVTKVITSGTNTVSDFLTGTNHINQATINSLPAVVVPNYTQTVAPNQFGGYSPVVNNTILPMSVPAPTTFNQTTYNQIIKNGTTAQALSYIQTTGFS
jgi:hypothetical protein